MDIFVSDAADSVSQLVGKTPLLRINRLSPNPSVDIYAKLEGFNPTGSLKDRIAERMVREGEESGELRKGKVVLEATSGNTGIALARIASMKGYRSFFAIPASVSIERILIMKAFGADMLLTPVDEGEDGAIRRVRRIYDENPEKYWYPDQFNNEANWKAHYKTTGPEVWEQTNRKVTHFVMGMGTSGTVTGVGRYLKEKDPDIRIFGVTPAEGSEIQGLKEFKGGLVPGIYDESLLDGVIEVSDEEADRWAINITRKEGVFVGKSSGVSLAASRKIAGRIDSGVIVTIFGDMGFKYLTSEPYYNREILQGVEKARETEEVVEL